MKKEKVLFLLSILTIGLRVSAQEDKSSTFTVEGKPIVTVFGNFYSGFNNENDDRGFNMERSYFGYQGKVLSDLEYKVVMDIGKSSNVGDYQRLMYLKNAKITWKSGNLKLNAGLIGMNQFEIQEKFWDKRYLMKSFQDEYKFGSSADLGLSAEYKFADWLSGDITIVNGEGYKKVQVNDGLLYGAGITVAPVKGLTLRVYGDINEATVDGTKDKDNFCVFAGYKTSILSIGAEYNSLNNSGNVNNQDETGYSVYASATLSPQLEFFGRWDMLKSKNDWNENNDGQLALFGLQYKVNKYVKIAPNFRIWNPKADGADNKPYGYISAIFSL